MAEPRYGEERKQMGSIVGTGLRYLLLWVFIMVRTEWTRQ